MKKLTADMLKSVIEASAQGVIVFSTADPGWPAVFVNEELVQITGVPAEKWFESGLDMLVPIFPESDIRGECDRSIDNVATADLRAIGVRLDGSGVYVDLHLSAITARDNSVSHVAIFLRDLHSAEQTEGVNDESDLEVAIPSDRLTGLPHRRYFERILTREWGSSIRDKTSLALFLIRIDEFREYSNTFGKQAGDTCLRQIAGAVKAVARRSSDLAARFENEIFVTIARDMDTDQCEQLGKKIISQVSSLCIHHPRSSVHRYVSVSIGAVSAIPTQGAFPLEAIEEAREALDEALARGGRGVLCRQLKK